MKDNNKLNIALFLGGTSPEKEVSKSSSKSIHAALVNLGHNVILFNPAYGTNQPENIDDFFTEKDYTDISNDNYVKTVNSPLLDNVDLVFLGLHGKWGEDGTIQSLLELRGKKYTGTKVLGSSISMDKKMSKILFEHYGIKTPKWIAVPKNNFEPEQMIEMIKKVCGLPCVIKPNDQGSTVGLTICENESQVVDAVHLALEFSDKALIEEYIDGHELTVGVIEDKFSPFSK